ncbi:MAG: glycerol-3-phosphate 1-O-acyltransferase PlsY [Kiritimatiellae bacterium]|nr:glycerol-3-phosphate 1-O-acyltransferase PlsY [Kiritimatiellia bacterium]
MNIYLTIILGAVASYLLGSIPFGLIISHFRGVDIQKVGSCNIGATNVFRSVGKGWGLFTFALDVFKGYGASCLIAKLAVHLSVPAEHLIAISLLYACSAVAGHNWSIFLRFKGGKGVATTVGAILGIAPLMVGVGFIAWVIVFVTTRYVSLASILTAIAISVYAWVTKEQGELLLPSVLTVLALLIIWRHKANIGRLLSGTENRFNFKKKKA